LGHAIVDADGGQHVVVKFEVSLPACEHVFNEVSISTGDSACSHIVDELGFDHIGKSALDVQEKGCGNFTCSPCVFDSARDHMHCISGVAAMSSSELTQGEHVVGLC